MLQLQRVSQRVCFSSLLCFVVFVLTMRSDFRKCCRMRLARWCGLLVGGQQEGMRRHPQNHMMLLSLVEVRVLESVRVESER